MKVTIPQIYVITLALSSLALAACSGGSAQPAAYTVGGTVINLAPNGGSLVLRDNLKDNLKVSANGRFTFANSVQSSDNYSVTISAQPTNPAQTCAVTNGTGVVGANVTNIEINCGHNEWTWETGASTVNPPAVYGSLGVAAPNNSPGARQYPATWSDAQGNLWLFGGYAFNTGSTYLPINDLWKYNSGQWTWMGGSDVGGQNGVYGSIGLPALDNIPGARSASVAWTDLSGNFWLFGGMGYDSAGTEASLNDLWMYSNGSWTWMSGSNLVNHRGVYGTIGIPSPNNVPGARNESVSWVDSSGNLWLFGGLGYDSAGTNGLLNDLWKFSAGQWTWVSGSNLANQTGVYGSQGVPAPDNVPGGRFAAANWKDSSGNFWLFGGTQQSGLLNDLWKFSNGQWTWVSGSNQPYQLNVYGVQAVPSASNFPGARQNALSWTDLSGNFWLFGGNGPITQSQAGLFNDLWKYSSGEWTWMSGSNSLNQNGIYGTQGMPFPGNIPGARFVSCSWVDTNGNLWLFGGYGVPASGTEGNLNDLWMYLP